MSIVPAWSEAFHGEGPGPAPALAFPRRLTRRWAFGDCTGEGVTVAVIDSGIDATHPMVEAVDRFIAVERDADAPDGIRFVDSHHDDLYGHGTACAGIIRSLAPGVRLISVRVLGSNLKGSAQTFLHGLDWCIQNGVNIVNLSMSTTNEQYLESFHNLVDQAIYRRVMIVSAMNNERKRSIPSEFAGVFSVACGPGSDRERFSCNPHGPAEWGAAGIEVEVAWLDGRTMRATGNSFAAPVIAGHLARLIGHHPGVTPWQARTILAQLADNNPGREA